MLALALEAVGYFAAGAVLALVWACYSYYCSQKRPVLAAAWSGGIYALGCFSAISYVAHHWLAVPLGVGDVLGTYLTLKYMPDAEAKDTEKAANTGTT